MLTFSVSLQSSSCKSVVPCMHRLHQFLSALARARARADKTDAAFACMDGITIT